MMRAPALLLLALLGASPGPDAAALLPSPCAVPGWLGAGEPRVLPASELWQQIDGAAEQYITYGCSLLTVADFRREGGEAELTVEIYTFAEELGSFGLYALERPVHGPYLELGTQGYQASGDLNFLCGRHYFKLRVYPEGEAEIAALNEFARANAAQQCTGAALPSQLAIFPEEELIPDSFGFVPRAALGLEGLDRALSAKYHHAGGDITLYLVREENPEAATAKETKTRAALARRSTEALEEMRIGDTAGVRGELKYYGSILLLRSGGDLLLAAGAIDSDGGRRSVERVLAALSGRAPAAAPPK